MGTDSNEHIRYNECLLLSLLGWRNGIRSRLKIYGPKGYMGSIPIPSTMKFKLVIELTNEVQTVEDISYILETVEEQILSDTTKLKLKEYCPIFSQAKVRIGG